MGKIIIVRTPEADFRPEKHITNAIVAELNGSSNEVTEMDFGRDFVELGKQSDFYNTDAMFQNYMSLLDALPITGKGDTLFFGDAWTGMMPVVRTYAFLKHGSPTALNICGLFHSSWRTPGDLFEQAGDWVGKMEATIMASMDRVYVATEYSHNQLRSNRFVSHEESVKVRVLGLPMTQEANNTLYKTTKGSGTVIFAHRWAEDKNPAFFVALAKEALALDRSLTFRVLHPVPLPEDEIAYARSIGIEFKLCPTRDVYFTEMSRAETVISTATLETFGYALMEGVQMGARPFAPNTACYPYLYAKKYLYSEKCTAAMAAAQLVQQIHGYDGPQTDWSEPMTNACRRPSGGIGWLTHSAENIANDILALHNRPERDFL